MTTKQKRAFTLLEILVVIIIMAAISGFALVNYNKTVLRTYERDAVLQLTSMHAANQIYYAKEEQFWPTDGGTYGLATINTDLGLNIIANGMTYTCTGDGATFSCSALRDGGTFTASIDEAAVDSSNPCCSAGSCPTLPNC